MLGGAGGGARQAAKAAAQAEERVAAFERTQRYRLAQALARPLDQLRR